VELDPVQKAVAAWLWSGRRAVLAGLSAGALHGMRWIDADLPAELNRQSRDKARGIVLHSDALADDEICLRRGMPTTTAARTAFDLGRNRDVPTAVIRLDALRNATRVSVDEINNIVARHPGARWITQLREAIELSDAGAESPQETRTRLLLVGDGLPPLRTQIEVRDRYQFVARLDMGWPEFLVAVEFDGAQHWTDARQRSRDIDRIAELEALDWIVIRVSGEMLKNRPNVILHRVRQAPAQRGLDVDKTA
ncbi:MAG: endonuclease domain-containing protein, partial [Mycobacterium sp.]